LWEKKDWQGSEGEYLLDYQEKNSVRISALKRGKEKNAFAIHDREEKKFPDSAKRKIATTLLRKRRTIVWEKERRTR